jgi:capsular polysaccharide biosynthesis protein
METMEFLRRWWWLLVLGMFAAVIPAYLFTNFNDDSRPVYKSTAILLVVGDDVQASERLTTTYARLIELQPVYAEVRSRLNLSMTEDELDEKTSVSSEFTTQLIEIEVEDSDPARAADIANTVVTVFLERIDIQVGRTGTATVASSATPAGEPEGDLGGFVLLAAAIVGVMVAASIGVGIEWLGGGVEV